MASAEPSRRTTLVLARIIILALYLAAVLLVDHTIFSGRIEGFLGLEPFKLVLQFLLITVLGGAVFGWLNARKEEQARRDARIA